MLSKQIKNQPRIVMLETEFRTVYMRYDMGHFSSEFPLQVGCPLIGVKFFIHFIFDKLTYLGKLADFGELPNFGKLINFGELAKFR